MSAMKKIKPDNEAEKHNDSETSGCKLVPRKLFDICVDFIANNLKYVDSLVGFPEIIGQKIFNKAEKDGYFDCPDDTCWHVMNLFQCAYKDLILDSLDLRRSHLAIGLYQEHFEVFTNLTHLDLGQCKLGDEHDILLFISHLDSLQSLLLDDNALSDLGVQKMTIPMSVKKKGPSKLKKLDLSCNPDISFKAAKYLKRFKWLEHLDLSGTKFKEPGLQELGDAGFISCCNECTQLDTSGWAAQIVEKWKLIPKKKTQSVITGNAAATKFYSRKNTRMDMINSTISVSPPKRNPIVILSRKDPAKRTLQKSSLNKPPELQLRKKVKSSHTLKSIKTDNRQVKEKSNKKTSTDPYFQSPVTASDPSGKITNENVQEMDPILAGYLTEPVKCNMQKNKSLWSAMNSW